MRFYHPRHHNRRSIRLKGYDYAQKGLYFLTLNTQNRARLFGEISCGQMMLNPFGVIAHDQWLNSSKVRRNVRVHAFVIMPDHIHGILEITENINPPERRNEVGKFRSPSNSVGAIIRGYKIATIKRIKEEIQDPKMPLPTGPTQIIKTLNFKIWQRNYYERIVRNARAYDNITRYIINNPKKWEEKKK